MLCCIMCINVYARAGVKLCFVTHGCLMSLDLLCVINVVLFFLLYSMFCSILFYNLYACSVLFLYVRFVLFLYDMCNVMICAGDVVLI